MEISKEKVKEIVNIFEEMVEEISIKNLNGLLEGMRVAGIPNTHTIESIVSSYSHRRIPNVSKERYVEDI